MRGGLWLLMAAFVGGCGAEGTDGGELGPDASETGETIQTGETGDVTSVCAGLVCNTPPAASCISATTLRVWASGTCVEPSGCEYTAYTDQACAAGCEGGACKGDPCANVTCNAPPSPCHEAVGTCQSGVCSYDERLGEACDDGDACTTDDTCDNGCGGRLIACNRPPADACADATTLVVYAATGVCGGDGCSYASERVTCADGCVDGACAGDPCAAIACDDAPSACHAQVGTCVSGVCRYDFDDGASCDDGDTCTSNDRCEAGLCGGSDVTCDTPPPATCSNGILAVPVETGTCDDGACSYEPQAVTCTLGCDPSGTSCAGDPCANVTCTTPPAPTCVGNVRRTFAGGTCSGGTCTYVESTQTCPNGCAVSGCIAPSGTVISELVYDAVGADDDVFVELHGTPGASLVGLTLVGRNGNGGTEYQAVALTGTFDSAGLFVIADPNASADITDVADQLASAVDYQNGPDSIELRNGVVVLDALGYGAFAAADVFKGEGSAHPGIDSPGQSLARDIANRDTNDNAADFAVFAKPTPGAANIVDTTLEGCGAERIVWGAANCGDDLAAAAHGAVVAATSDVASTTGSATATCNDGNWIVTGTSCAAVGTYDAMIVIQGEGSGVVTSDFPGLTDCRSGTCRVPYTGVHDVTFTATPDDGSVVGEWLGQPQCGTGNSCVINLPGDDNRGAVVRFDLAPVDIGWLSVAVGWESTYAVRADGTLWGWGRLHPASSGAEIEEHRPVRIGAFSQWTKVVNYEERVCGLMGRFLYCWGDGPVGDGTNSYRVNPVRILSNQTWSDIAMGGGHTCAITLAVGTIYCWGANGFGQSGTSPLTPVLVPTEVKYQGGTAASDWRQVATGGAHTCGANSAGVWCWGGSSAGQYDGNGGSGLNYSHWPVRDIGTVTSALLSAGRLHTCRLVPSSQSIRCSGNNSDGQTGRDDNDENAANTLRGWTQLDAGDDSTCGVAAGKAYCFGDAGGEHAAAVQMGTRDDFVSVDVGGGLHQCALTTAGALYCWGDNANGQLGDGMTTDRSSTDMVLVLP